MVVAWIRMVVDEKRETTGIEYEIGTKGHFCRAKEEVLFARMEWMCGRLFMFVVWFFSFSIYVRRGPHSMIAPNA